MSVRVVIGCVAFCVAMAGIFVGNLFMAMMIREINRKRPDGDLISYFGFAFPKIRRIFAEYRRLYPNRISCGFVGMFVFALCARIIG
jgi:hypothetical protein